MKKLALMLLLMFFGLEYHLSMFSENYQRITMLGMFASTTLFNCNPHHSVHLSVLPSLLILVGKVGKKIIVPPFLNVGGILKIKTYLLCMPSLIGGFFLQFGWRA